ncbi:hypothetical protein V1290_006845 [Bradyrhizobium sp. AZCC 1578]
MAVSWWRRTPEVPTKSSSRPGSSCVILRLVCIWSRRSHEVCGGAFFWLQSMIRDGYARSPIFDLDIRSRPWWSGLGETTVKRSN